MGRTAVAQTPLSSRYTAAEGFLPNQPQWTLFGGTGTSSIADGRLTIGTLSDTQNQGYLQTSSAFSNPLPDPLIVEARVRLISGSASQADRAPISIAITTAPNIGIGFFVDAGRIFLTAGQLPGGSVVGSTAFVSTDDAFHTYRIAIHGGGAVDVSYDGVATLSGQTHFGPDDHGLEPRILWGEGSSVAHGVSKWEFFRHNAGRADACGADLAAAQLQIGQLQTSLDATNATIAQLTTQNSNLTNQVSSLQAALDAANARIAQLQTDLVLAQQAAAHETALVSAQMAALLADLRLVFGNPQFVLPGATPFEQLQNLVNAVIQLNKGRKQGVYVSLGGKP